MDSQNRQPSRQPRRPSLISDFGPAPVPPAPLLGSGDSTGADKPGRVIVRAQPQFRQSRPPETGPHAGPRVEPPGAPPLRRSFDVSVSPISRSANTAGTGRGVEPRPPTVNRPPTAPRPVSASVGSPPVSSRHQKDRAGGRQGLRDLLSIIGVLASAFLLAFCLISFVFQSYQVDGPSMQTTLENNDHLIVWKVQRTIARVSGSAYIPHRGDVVVFNEPTNAGGESRQLIKRVIGLPGERVVVRDNAVTVYNKAFPNGFSPDKTLPYGSVIKFTPGTGDWTLGANQIFVMGDHRDNSLDSRYFGPVNAGNLIGKLILRVLPLSNIKSF